MIVSDLMTRGVVTCAPHDSLEHAAQLMWDADCGCLPVVDAGRVIGMITDRDVCMGAYTQGRLLRDLNVFETMAHEVFACLPDDSLAEAEAIMRLRRVRRLPVVDLTGRLVGLISLNDVARESMRQHARKQKDVTPDEVAATLAAICQPRQSPRIPASA
jgi:CBS domain-containing protein